MYYFASDIHLGIDAATTSLEREKLLVRWLNEVAEDAKGIFLVGDIFDFWFEWKRVIPKGYSRLLGTLSELSDKGIEIYFFVGNHDMWAYNYLEKECGVKIYKKAQTVTLNGKRVFIAHGDNMYIKRPFAENTMQKVFKSNFLRWAFAKFVHPNIAIRFGMWWSKKSRQARPYNHTFRDDDEYLVQYAKNYQANVAKEHIDYFIFGHIHCANIHELSENQNAVFLGEWLDNPTYAVMDDKGTIELKEYR